MGKESKKDKLYILEQNISELKKIKKEVPFSDLKNNKREQWALRYGFFESIQIIIDISCHLVVKNNLGNPKKYSDCIELLEKNDYISNDLKEKLSKIVGLRNILIHEYIDIEIEKLYDLVDKVDDFKSFTEEIIDYI